MNLVAAITQVLSTDARKFMTSYTVQELCSPSILVAPARVKLAVDSLNRQLISDLFGYQFDGDFIRSTSISTTSPTPAVDRKLWLIGATIGPVAFIIFLIFVFCYLHYKCRPRPRPPDMKRVKMHMLDFYRIIRILFSLSLEN